MNIDCRSVNRVLGEVHMLVKMNGIRNIVVMFVLGIMSVSGLAMAGDVDSRFKLVWSDEFNYTGAPDSRYWDYEEGFIRGSGNESQYYTRDRRQNVRVENGCLVIEAHKERFKNKDYKPGVDHWRHWEYGEYTSGSINTLGKFSQQYGRFEFRAKLPRGQGVFPAVWMMGDDFKKIDWPKCGEIDVMEFIGKEPTSVHGTIHFPLRRKTNDPWASESRTKKTTDSSISNTFNVYAVEWFPDRIDFYFNDRNYHTVKMSSIGPNEPFHKPFFILINLAIGSAWGGPIDPAVLPQRLEVDYVRVYKLNK